MNVGGCETHLVVEMISQPVSFNIPGEMYLRLGWPETCGVPRMTHFPWSSNSVNAALLISAQEMDSIPCECT